MNPSSPTQPPTENPVQPGAMFTPSPALPQINTAAAVPSVGATIQPAPATIQPDIAPNPLPQTSFAAQQTPSTTFQPQPQMPSAAAPMPAAAQPTVPAAPSGKATTRPTNPNSTQNTLLIAEIRDGIVIMNDGSFRSVVMVKSVNFDLMSPKEQEAVEFSYQGFLNSLYFPIQIFVRSQKVDLAPYITKLDKIRGEHDNMLLAMMMGDYIDYIEQLGQQTNIMDKKFYIVVPFFPQVDVQKAITQSKNFVTGFLNLFNTKEQHVVINEAELEKAKTELRNRVQAVLQALMQCGVQGLPLDTQELIELYYDTYNPDTATRQQLKNFNDLGADVITKGKGAAPQAHLQREMS